jgi:hypothetical protein
MNAGTICQQPVFSMITLALVKCFDVTSESHIQCLTTLAKGMLGKAADYRKSHHDAIGKQKMHDVRLLALGAFRLIARDLVFDALEELNGISSTAN